MTKLRGIQWLESQTGQVLDAPAPSPDDSRHLSMRLPSALHLRLEEIANERRSTVSQVVRQMISDAIALQDQPDRAAIDTAIAALDEMRRRLPTSAA